MTKKSQKPLHEGNTRGEIKGGAQKPTPPASQRPKSPPPAPKPKK